MNSAPPNLNPQFTPGNQQFIAVSSSSRSAKLLWVVILLIAITLISIIVLLLTGNLDKFITPETTSPTTVPSLSISPTNETPGTEEQGGYEIFYQESSSLKTHNTLTDQTVSVAELSSDCLPYKSSVFTTTHSTTHKIFYCTDTIKIYSNKGELREIPMSKLLYDQENQSIILSDDGKFIASTASGSSHSVQIYNTVTSQIDPIPLNNIEPGPTTAVDGEFSVDNKLFYIKIVSHEGFEYERYVYNISEKRLSDSKDVLQGFYLGRDGYRYTIGDSGSTKVEKYDFTLENLVDTYEIGVPIFAEMMQMGDFDFNLEVSKDGKFMYIKSSNPACGYVLNNDESVEVWKDHCPNPDEGNKFIVYDTEARTVRAQIPQSEFRNYAFSEGRTPNHLIQMGYDTSTERSRAVTIQEYSNLDKTMSNIFTTTGDIFLVNVL